MTPTSNPANPPGAITPGTPCRCRGCGAHPGSCRAAHLRRHPATRALLHLQAGPGGGAVCPYCHLTATRPGATSAAAAALDRPAADHDQPDLFDPTPYTKPARTHAPRGGTGGRR
jgi:hypothetical protein